ATRKNHRGKRKNHQPKGHRCDDAILVRTRKLEVTLQPAWLQFQRARLVTRDLQIGSRLRMMSVQCKRALVLQNRVPKILCSEICIAEVVEQIWVPLACANQGLVPRNSFFKMSLCKFLVRLCKLWIRLRKCG